MLVPVDAAIAYYTDKLGFSLAADIPYGEGDRWVEVAPPNGGGTIALVPPYGSTSRDEGPASRSTPPTRALVG